MKCYYCGKSLSDRQKVPNWHARCIRHFFGTTDLPSIELKPDTFEQLARDSTSKGYTVPGVQKKLSLHLISDNKQPRLTIINHPTGYILKPQLLEFLSLPEAEHLVMSMAKVCGITTVPHALVRLNDELAYITKRVDRVWTSKTSVQSLAMEDFCQLDLRLTQDKYKGSYERCAKIIMRYSSRTGLDLSELYLRLVFCYLVGNSDMHLKNFSLLETEWRSGEYTLSPAYDLLPVNAVLLEDTEETALTLNGKKNNIRRKDFLVFAEGCGINPKAASKMLEQVVSFTPRFESMVKDSFVPDQLKNRLLELMVQRVKRLDT